MSSHDTTVTETTTTVSPRVKVMRRTAKRVLHRERGKAALLAPVAWLATLHCTAWAADAVHAHPLIRAGVIAAAAVAVLGRAERRGEDLPVVPVTAGVLWAVAASVFGPYGWVALLLWIAGIVMAVPYWLDVVRQMRCPKPKQEQEPAPKKELPVSVPPEIKLWDERVVPNNAAYKLTRLEDVKPVPDGHTALIVGEPGSTLFSKMTAETAVETVASAHQVRTSQVAIEEADDGDASRARVTVIRSDSNLQQCLFLEDSGAAIDPKTGVAQIGRYFDLAPAHRQFFTPSGGAQMGIVVGDTESGKSNHGSGLISLCHESELMATALLDPQNGGSQPDWAGKTDIYAEGHEGCYEKLQLIDFVMQKQADFVAHVPWVDGQGRERTGKPYLLPGDPDLDNMTMLVVFLEELRFFLDSPFGKPALELLGTAVRTWRKAGAGLIVFNQNLGLDNFGGSGSSQSFRANLASGSVAAFRTGSSSDHHMIGLEADPSKLPAYFRNGDKTAGLGYLKGVDRRPAAAWRALPVKDAFGIASRPPAGGLCERTKSYIEEYHHHVARGRDVQEVAVPKPRREAVKPTSGDVQAAVERALLTGPMEVGAVCVAVRRQLGEAVPLAEIPAALRRLTGTGVVHQKGDVYQLAPVNA